MSTIIATTPNNLQTDVPVNVYAQVQFDTDIDPTSITTFTVILAESETEVLVTGVPNYIYGTRTVTFQLFENLSDDTEYTLIIVGGDYGLMTTGGVAALTDNYVIRFATGDTVDPDIPYAHRGSYSGNQPFTGTAGIYQQVYERTGEPISHIVTTAATVGPDGNIIPQAAGALTYLLASGQVEYLEVESTSPVDDATSVVASGVTLDFDLDITVPLPPSGTITNDHLYIESVNFAGLFGTDDVTYTYTIVDDEIRLVITNLEDSAIYTITAGVAIKGTGDLSLETPYEFSFRTLIAPFYTTIATIRAGLGSLITGVSDADIELLIYNYSNIVKEEFTIEGSPTTPAVKYVICAVKLDLIRRRLFEGGPVTRKRLADLEIDQGRNFSERIGGLMKELKDCMAKNWDILSGGTGFNVRSAVKGNWDPRRPGNDESWRRLGTVKGEHFDKAVDDSQTEYTYGDF